MLPKRVTTFVVACLCAVAAASQAEVIEIRTGQVGGVPGTPPTSDHNGPVDDCFRTIHNPTCGQPLSPSPFTAADFSAARTSTNFASLVAPAGAWLPSLPADPAARWIHWNHGTVAGGSGEPPGSVLYACDFAVETPCPTATIECWWAVDDALGDTNGPNPVGVYLNGVPLTPAFSGGSFGAQSYASTTVSLNPTNTLYVYQADGQCAVSGLILSARITCDSEGEIHGTKYWDQDCDGVRDAGEPGLAGWTIELTGPVNATTTTDANGNYFFVVPPGTYQVSEVTQPCWTITDPPGGVHTVTVDCFETVSGIDFGNCVCEEPAAELPPCLVAWYPFDEGVGSTTLEIGTASVANLVNGPNWIGTPGNAHLDFPLATDYVDGPAPPQPTFGSSDFTISARIRTSNTDASQRTIVDKSAGLQGWHMYLQNGRLGIDIGDPTLRVPYLSTGTSVTDGLWHTVTAVVCRDTGPGTGGVDLYVDGVLDASFPSASMPVGSFDAPVPLRFGQDATLSSAALSAELDDVMFFNCCFDASIVATLGAPQGYASGQCSVPSTITACGQSATTTIKICNTAAVPRTYTWTIAGLPVSSGCTIPGPTSFSPATGTVTLAGGQCQQIPVTMALPPGLTGTNIACYQVTVLEHETGRCFKCDGDLRAPAAVWYSTDDPYVDVPVGPFVEVAFELENTGPDVVVLDLELVPWSLSADGPSPILGLDGLPPGEPIVRTVKLPPEGIAPVPLEVRFEDFEALALHEVRLRGDAYGEGTFDTIAVIGLSATGGTTVSVEPPASVAPSVIGMRAAPNPFAATTALRFELDRAQAATLGVYDVTGRLVRSLVDGELAGGQHVVRWDGRGHGGRPVPSGVYWLRLETPEATRTARVLRLP